MKQPTELTWKNTIAAIIISITIGLVGKGLGIAAFWLCLAAFETGILIFFLFQIIVMLVIAFGIAIFLCPSITYIAKIVHWSFMTFADTPVSFPKWSWKGAMFDWDSFK